jgi:hypothetical protein
LRLDTTRELRTFCDDIQIFRTVLQHNLNLSDANDFAKLVRLEEWMAENFGISLPPTQRFWPNSESQWRILAQTLRKRARQFVTINIDTVKIILKDEFLEDILREWIFRQTRSLPAHIFDGITNEAAGDLGLKHLDVIRLRKIHLDEWNRRLRLLPESSDAMREARRLVEQTLLVEAENFLPITGADVIETLGVAPGPEVGKFLRMARELYRKERCSSEVLLQQLRTHQRQ